MTERRSHDLSYAFSVLIENHNGRATLISSYVIFVSIDLSVNQPVSVIVDERHQFAVSWRVNLTHFPWTQLIVVKELRYVAEVIFACGKPETIESYRILLNVPNIFYLFLPVQVIIEVSNIESPSFRCPHQQSFGIVVKLFLPGVLYN